MPAEGPADGAQRLLLPVAAAARPQRHDRRARLSRRRPDRAPLRGRRRDRGPRQGRALPRRARGRARRRPPARARRASTRRSSCPPRYRSVEELEGFLEHLTREIHDPALRAVVEAVVFTGPLADEFRRAPVHARRPPRLPRRPARAHGRGRRPWSRETCQLHPRLDSDLLMAAAILHDVGERASSPTAPSSGSARRARMLGHLAIGAEIVGAAAGSLPEQRRLALLNCVLSHHGPDAGPGRAARRWRRLRLRRGARALPAQRARRLGQGRARARSPLGGRAAATRSELSGDEQHQGGEAETSRARSETAFASTDAGDAPQRRERAEHRDRRGGGRCRSRSGARRRRARPGRSPAARSPRRAAAARRGRSPAPGRRGSRRRRRAARRRRRRRTRGAPRATYSISRPAARPRRRPAGAANSSEIARSGIRC